MSLPPRWSLFCIPLSLVAYCVQARAFESGTASLVLLFLSLSFWLAGTVTIATRSTGKGKTGKATVVFLLPSLAAAAALALHWFFARQADPETAGQSLRGVGVIGSVFLGFLATATSLAIDFAAEPMRLSQILNTRRLTHASLASATLVLAFFALLGGNFISKQRDVRRDHSVGSTTSPSEATLSLLDAAPGLEVFLFFAQGSEALAELDDYFGAFRQAGVSVTTLDSAIDPKLAEELSVRRNGIVTFRSGERVESWFVGTERKDVLRKRKKIDKEVRTRMSKVSRETTTMYVTVGHGERQLGRAREGGRAGLYELKRLLRTLNVSVKELGLGNGLADGVPDDADIVAVVGPVGVFQEAEIQSLISYSLEGGSLYMLIDPDVSPSLAPLMRSLGVSPGESSEKQSAATGSETFVGAEILNEKHHYPVTRTPADFSNLIVQSFSSHDAIGTLHSSGGKTGVIFHRAREVAMAKGYKGKATTIAKSHPMSFVDMNQDRRFDPALEQRGPLSLAVAIEDKVADGARKRAIIVGDSDVLADNMMKNQTHQIFGLEQVLWLMKDDIRGGALPESTDTPIAHSRDEDSLWFYATTFGVPMLFIFAGARAARRGRGSASS